MILVSGDMIAMYIDHSLLKLAQHTFMNFTPFVTVYFGSVVAVFIDFTLKKSIKVY